MNRIGAPSLFLLALLCALVEPVLANKFTTISGGVNGMSREKIAILKQISLYAGGFLLMLAVVAVLTRKRFEGFVGYTSKKDLSTAVKGAAVLSVAGAILLLIGAV